jgi:hypothetical protein
MCDEERCRHESHPSSSPDFLRVDIRDRRATLLLMATDYLVVSRRDHLSDQRSKHVLFIALHQSRTNRAGMLGPPSSPSDEDGPSAGVWKPQTVDRILGVGDQLRDGQPREIAVPVAVFGHARRGSSGFFRPRGCDDSDCDSCPED